MSASVAAKAGRWNTSRLEYLEGHARAVRELGHFGVVESKELSAFQDRIGTILRWGNLLTEHDEALKSLVRTKNIFELEDWEAVYAGRGWDGKTDGTLYLYMLLTRLYKARWLGQVHGERKAQ